MQKEWNEWRNKRDKIEKVNVQTRIRNIGSSNARDGNGREEKGGNRQ